MQLIESTEPVRSGGRGRLMSNQFNERLNSLFETADFHVTNAMVVRGMTEFGCRISTPYLSQTAHRRPEPIRPPEVVCRPRPLLQRPSGLLLRPVRSHSAPRSQVARQTSPSSNSCTTCACGTSPPVSSTSHRLHRICLSKWRENLRFLRKSSARTTGLEFLHVTRIAPFARLSLTAQGGFGLMLVDAAGSPGTVMRSPEDRSRRRSSVSASCRGERETR